MYGAILGDMIGAPYEFDRSPKTKDFPLFSRRSKCTDDTVMTIAVAEALLNTEGKPDHKIRAELISTMRRWGKKYPNAGYGGRFYGWLKSRNPKPYGSYGNGSAMRVSAVGWLYDTMYETRRIARLTAQVTHNHPEGIKGAEATASAIFLARTGHEKDEIKDYIVREYDYDLSRSCDEIRPTYHHVESCQETVPEAITAFLEGTDFEDVIRTAVSLGGDSDTLACIAGSIAEAFYSIPEDMVVECRNRMPRDLLAVLDRFSERKLLATSEYSLPEETITPELLEDGTFLKRTIEICNRDRTEQNIFMLLQIFRDSLVWIPCTVLMSDADYATLEKLIKDAEENGGLDTLAGKILHNQNDIRMVPDILQYEEEYYFPVFTSKEEMGEYGQPFSKVQKHFLEAAHMARNNKKNVSGIIINACSEPFIVPCEIFDVIAKIPSCFEVEEE